MLPDKNLQNQQSDLQEVENLLHPPKIQRAFHPLVIVLEKAQRHQLQVPLNNWLRKVSYCILIRLLSLVAAFDAV